MIDTVDGIDKIDDIDKNIVVCLSGDMVVSKDLYRDLSEKIGISEDELIERLKRLSGNKVLKRIGPVMRHQKSGFVCNAMAVWNVDEDKLENAIEKVKSFKSISHVYERETNEKWNYNLYTMIHGQSKEEVEELVQRLYGEIGASDYRVLYTKHEWKKTSPDLGRLMGNR